MKRFSYSDYIFNSVVKEFTQKYRNSLLGSLWVIIYPVVLVLIYTIIFSNILSSKFSFFDHKYSYSIYLCSGIIIWNYFSELLMKTINIFLDNSEILKKVSVPRFLFLIIITIASTLNHLIMLVIFIVFLFIIGFLNNISIADYLYVYIVTTFLALSLGFFLSMFNVFYRDIGHFMNVFIQLWFWATPIVYVSDLIPSSLMFLMNLNPLYKIVEGYHQIFFLKNSIDWLSFTHHIFLILLLILSSLFLYKKTITDILDEI